MHPGPSSLRVPLELRSVLGQPMEREKKGGGGEQRRKVKTPSVTEIWSPALQDVPTLQRREISPL